MIFVCLTMESPHRFVGQDVIGFRVGIGLKGLKSSNGRIRCQLNSEPSNSSVDISYRLWCGFWGWSGRCLGRWRRRITISIVKV